MEKKDEFVGMLENNQIKPKIKEEGDKLPQYIYAAIAAFGAFAVGTVGAWTSPNLDLLRDVNSTTQLHLSSKVEESWISALTPIGAILGALSAGFFADLLGRKKTLIAFTIPLMATWVMLIFGTHVFIVYISRFISGIVVGLFCTVIPLYVNEISEDSIRGTLGTFFQVFQTLGQLFDYTLTLFDSYYVVNMACGMISILYFVILFFSPESPVHQTKKNKKLEAEKSLRRLRGPSYNIHEEFDNLRKNSENSKQQSISLGDVLTAVNMKALVIALGLMLCQQLSGINAVIFFAKDIFEEANASDPTICTIVMGIVQCLVTIVSSILVDRAGRRVLLLASSIGMGIVLAIFGYYFKLKVTQDVTDLNWLPLTCLVVYIVVFSLGFGPLPWMMSSEILAPEIKSFGSGLAVATNWICVSLVTFFFNPIKDSIGDDLAFWTFSVVSFIAAVFVFIIVPETKGKSMQQIQNELAGNRSITRL